MNGKQIGEIVKIRRKELKITQPILAMLAGVGLNTLVSIERGNGNPKIGTVMQILDTLGLKIEVSFK